MLSTGPGATSGCSPWPSSVLRNPSSARGPNAAICRYFSPVRGVASCRANLVASGWRLVAGGWLLGAGGWLLGAGGGGWWLGLAAGCWCWWLVAGGCAGGWLLVAGCWWLVLVAGGWLIGGWRLGAGGWWLGAGGWLAGVGLAMGRNRDEALKAELASILLAAELLRCGCYLLWNILCHLNGSGLMRSGCDDAITHIPTRQQQTQRDNHATLQEYLLAQFRRVSHWCRRRLSLLE